MIRKKFLFFFEVVITWLLLCVPAFAENFYIEKYDVDIVVNKSKQLSITENIEVFFTNSSHGIYRKIFPEKATITDIDVSEQYNIIKDGHGINIKIGDPNSLIQGKHSYKISYKYNYFDNKNEFYHNIIGTDWETDIKNVTFNITMPKYFNPSDVGLSIGKYGVKGFDGGAVLKVNGLTISGKVDKILHSNEGVTIRLQVPEGYFDKVSNTRMFVCIALLCFITFISFIIWYKFGKDDIVIPIVTFYPPENMNMLQTEIAYKEKASIQGLIAMIFSLAQKGYIKIHDKKGEFSLEKIKNYEEKDVLEHSYMNALFSSKVKFSIKLEGDENIVTSNDLKYSKVFYKKCESIIDNANSDRNVIYEKNSINWGLRIIMAICLLLVVSITFLAFINFNFSNIQQQSLSPLYFMLVAIFTLFISKEKNISSIFISLLFIVIPFFIIINNIKDVVSNNLPIIITGLFCIIVCSICLYHLKKLNKTASIKLGKLLGFKNFIETVEKPRLEVMLEKDPQYFYNILPYAFLFGISEKWMKKVESIMPMNPSWYQGSSFNYRTFRAFSKSMKSVSIPSTSNGGVSVSTVSTRSGGGGGFVGGGGGRGGGGSW